MTGTLVIDAAAPDFADATAQVRVEEASRADLAAVVVAEASVTGVTHRAGDATLVRFALDCPEPDGAYGLRAWITLDPGGLFSTRHCAVVTGTLPLTVPLRYAGPAR